MSRNVPVPLQTALDTRATTTVYCWQVTRGDGVVLGFTEHDQDIPFGDVTFKASTSFVGSNIETQIELAVSNLEIVAAFNSEAITDDDIAAGLYDGSEIVLYLIDWSNPDIETNNIVVDVYTLGNVTSGDLGYQAELRNVAQPYQQYIGDLCAPVCRSDFGDTSGGLHGGCSFPLTPPVWTANTVHNGGITDQVVPAVANGYQYIYSTPGESGAVAPVFPTVPGDTVADGTAVITCLRAVTRTGTITAVTDRKNFTVGDILGDLTDGTGGSVGGGFFAFGSIKFTSGNNNGVAMQVNTFVGATGVTQMVQAFPRDIEVGDTVILQAGCDKTQPTCLLNWNNLDNRRAEDYVPGTDQVFKVNGSGG